MYQFFIITLLTFCSMKNTDIKQKRQKLTGRKKPITTKKDWHSSEGKIRPYVEGTMTECWLVIFSYLSIKYRQNSSFFLIRESHRINDYFQRVVVPMSQTFGFCFNFNVSVIFCGPAVSSSEEVICTGVHFE